MDAVAIYAIAYQRTAAADGGDVAANRGAGCDGPAWPPIRRRGSAPGAPA